MFEQLTPAQTVFMVVAWAFWAALIIALFVGAWHVGWIARSPVQPGPRQPAHTGPPEPRTQPEPQPDDRPGRHRRYPDPVPEEEEPRPVQVAGVAPEEGRRYVDSLFDTLPAAAKVLGEPTQQVSAIAWDDVKPAEDPFPTNLRVKDEELRRWAADPDRTGLIPPVTSRPGAA